MDESAATVDVEQHLEMLPAWCCLRKVTMSAMEHDRGSCCVCLGCSRALRLPLLECRAGRIMLLYFDCCPPLTITPTLCAQLRCRIKYSGRKQLEYPSQNTLDSPHHHHHCCAKLPRHNTCLPSTLIHIYPSTNINQRGRCGDHVLSPSAYRCTSMMYT